MRYLLSLTLLFAVALPAHALSQQYYGYQGQYNPYGGYGYQALAQNHQYANQPYQVASQPNYRPQTGYSGQNSGAVFATPRHMQAMQKGGFYITGQAAYVTTGDHDFDFATGSNIDTEMDGGFGLGLAVGYDFGHITSALGARTELEYMYRAADVESHSLNGANQTGATGDVTSNAFMWNGYLDWYALDWLTPYVGAGIGLATVDYNDYGVTAVPQVLDDGDTVFAYQGMIGSQVNITPTWALTADYRYFGTSDPEVTTASPNTTDAAYDTHNLMFGVKYTFK